MAVQRANTDGEGRPPEEGADSGKRNAWAKVIAPSGELLTPIEAAQYLRLHDTGVHTPESAIRTLNYWRSRGQLKATKFARRVWYLKSELDRFLGAKTEP